MNYAMETQIANSGGRLLPVERGQLVAELLTGAWRPSLAAPSLSHQELAEIAPVLLDTGAGGLAWWRVAHSKLRSSQAAQQLRQAYRLHTLQAAVHEREIRHAIAHLRQKGVEPLLGKGWVAAQLYPEPGLRPYGDIDLYLRPEEHATAVASLMAPGVQKVPVDIHLGFGQLQDRAADELYDRSRLVSVGGTQVRVLGAEDHLRLLCLHMLGHGAWRALWLCDIAAALESRPTGFDWDYFLSGNQRRSQWAVCVLGLANRLVGASLDGVPAAEPMALPVWLIRAVSRQWGEGTPYYQKTAMATHLRNRSGVLRAVRQRWPDPLQASVRLGVPLNGLPRKPIQIAALIDKTARFSLRLARQLTRGQTEPRHPSRSRQRV